MGPDRWSASPEETLSPRHATSHATAPAWLLAIPILTMSLLAEIALIAAGTLLFLLVLALIDHLENKENEEGRSLFHPWRVPPAEGDR